LEAPYRTKCLRGGLHQDVTSKVFTSWLGHRGCGQQTDQKTCLSIVGRQTGHAQFVQAAFVDGLTLVRKVWGFARLEHWL
jgi:hypothetical protein